MPTPFFAFYFHRKIGSCAKIQTMAKKWMESASVEQWTKINLIEIVFKFWNSKFGTGANAKASVTQG